MEELQKLSIEELAKLLTSRQRRTLTRGFTDAEKSLLEKIKKFKEGKKKEPVKNTLQGHDNPSHDDWNDNTYSLWQAV